MGKSHNISPETVKRWKEILAILNSEEYNQSLHAEVDKYVRDGYELTNPRSIKSMILSVLFFALSVSAVAGFVALTVSEIVLWNGSNFILYGLLGLGAIGVSIYALLHILLAWSKTEITHNKSAIYQIVEKQKYAEFGIVLSDEERKLFIEWRDDGDKKLVWFDTPIIEGYEYELPQHIVQKQAQRQNDEMDRLMREQTEALKQQAEYTKQQAAYAKKQAEQAKRQNDLTQQQMSRQKRIDPRRCQNCRFASSCAKIVCNGFKPK